MTPMDKAPDILGRAMLVNVNISVWEARKHDREVTEKVNKGYSPEAGRYHKHLFGGRIPELSAVLNAAHALRMMHYTQTLPWTDTGWRMLPTANYFEYTTAYRERSQFFGGTVDVFVERYAKLVKEAKEKLRERFRPKDYPDIGAVRSRFSVAIDWDPLPAEGDFRVSLPKEELAKMEKNVRRRMQEAVKFAMQDAYQRLGDAITDLRSHLDDGKYLRETMLTRIEEVADALGRLNLTDDPTLEQVRKLALKDLAKVDISGLRDDGKVRESVADKADDILKRMAGLYTPAKEDK